MDEEDNQTFPGPLSRALGLSLSALDGSSNTGFQVDCAKFSNGLVLELFMFVKKVGLREDTIVKWIENVGPTDVKDRMLQSCARSVPTHIMRLLKRKKELNAKRKNEDLQKLMSAKYEGPQTLQTISSNTSSEHSHSPLNRLINFSRQLVKDNNNFQSTLDKISDDYVQALSDLNQKTAEVQNLKDEMKRQDRTSREHSVKQAILLRQLKKDSDNMSTRLHDSLIKLSEYNTRNINKRLKRRDDKISAQENVIKQQQADKDERDELIKAKDRQIQELKSTVEEVQEKLDCAIRSKINAQRIKSHYKRFHPLCDEGYIDSLEDKVAKLEIENKELHGRMTRFLEAEDIKTFQDGKFTDEVRHVYMSLLSMDAGTQNIEPIIRTILKKLAGVEVGRLPKYSTARMMFAEARRLSQIHVADVVSRCENITVGTDGTTKKHDKYGSVSFFTSEGPFVAGIQNQLSGNTDQQVDMFKKVISDLASASSSSADELWLSIKNTMSDRHIVNKCLNKRLDEIREQALKQVIPSWDDKTQEERDDLRSMWHHFCSMHYVVGLATAAEAGLKKFEKYTAVNTDNDQQGESGTHRLIRTTCKAFAHSGACEKSGHPKDFESFLSQEDPAKKNELTSFRGERFNILFKNGGTVYHHRKDLSGYLATWESPNRLLQAVQRDLSEPVYVAGCLALGVINKIVTAPLWRLIESKKSILDMSDHFHQLQINFNSWAKDPQSLMAGEPLFPTVQAKQDAVFKSLFHEQDEELRTLTCQALKYIMEEFMEVTDRMLKDYLPGGLFHQPSVKQREQMTSCPTNNTGLERTFALLDRDVRVSPNATTLTREGKLMFKTNKTGNFLDTLSKEDKLKHFKDARKAARTDTKLHRQEVLVLREKRRQLLLDRVEKQTQKKAAKDATLRNLQDRVTPWQTPQEVEEELAKLRTKKKKIDALKDQLRFRRDVLHQHCEKTLFQFSRGGKPFGEEDLKANLLTLLQLN
ncbi:uncharacterized protein LOC144874669 [Branchiostoma floridae x Branchiostoma japonicum]